MSPAASVVVAGPAVLAAALDGQHDEVAAVGDHPGERLLADHARAWGDHDLGHAPRRSYSGLSPSSTS